MPHITFIHGIANKPEEDRLTKIWIDALAGDPRGNGDGFDLGANGITTSMIYWADVMYGKAEEIVTESGIDLESVDAVAGLNLDPDMAWRGSLAGTEKEMTDALAAKFSFDALVNDDQVPGEVEIARTLESIPLPWFLKRRILKWLLRDVHHYLFNETYSPREGVSFVVQDEIRARVLKKLKEVNTDKHIVISHSMGTVIMYDCLKRVQDCPEIDGLMTIGSPLGIDEVQETMKPDWNRNDGFPSKLKGPWINVFDPLDPVTGFDGNLSNDYRRNGDEIIEVINESNWGSWRHNITHYFSQPKMRAALQKMLND